MKQVETNQRFYSRRLCLVGVGLIGGSLARALKRARLCDEIVGCSRDHKHLQRAVDLGVIDRFDTELRKAARGADLVVIAVPLGATQSVMKQLPDDLADDAVITDVGSAKGQVVTDARRTLHERIRQFVPGHPIAGTEQSGVDASFADLFVEHYVVLTPIAETDHAALARIRAMWQAVDAQVVEMDVERHDQILAATSHLPHILAYTLVDMLAGFSDHEAIFRLAAGGFKDFTRIASSSPTMWHDICQANRDALIPLVERYRDQLEKLMIALRSGDSDYILRNFRCAKEARDTLIPALHQPGQIVPPDNGARKTKGKELR